MKNPEEIFYKEIEGVKLSKFEKTWGIVSVRLPHWIEKFKTIPQAECPLIGFVNFIEESLQREEGFNTGYQEELMNYIKTFFITHQVQKSITSPQFEQLLQTFEEKASQEGLKAALIDHVRNQVSQVVDYTTFETPEETSAAKEKTTIYQKKIFKIVAALTAQERCKNRNKEQKDILTGLLTRTSGLQQIYENLLLLGEQKSEVSSVAFAYLDIDNFKQINDTQGHEAGDEILRSIGKIINQSDLSDFDKNRNVTRLGGDEILAFHPQYGKDGNHSLEFEVLIPLLTQIETELKVTLSIGIEVISKKDAIDLGRKIKENIDTKNNDPELQNKALEVEAQRLKRTLTPHERKDALEQFYQVNLQETIIKEATVRADKALYEAKEKGRDTIVTKDSTHKPQ